MFKKISSVLLVSLMFIMPAYAQTADIPCTGNAPYKVTRLTPEVYQGANDDLSDLRLTNSKGEMIPYFIYSGEENITQQSDSYPMVLLNAYQQEEAFYFDYKVANPPDGDVLASALVLSTPKVNFAKDVTLLGSYDNQHWEKVQDDSLYCVDGTMKLEITFLSPQKYTHYRLKLSNNLEKISFDNVALRYSTATIQANDDFCESLQPRFTTEEVGQDTLLHIEGLKNLKLDKIILETDSMFRRVVTDPFGQSKELYHLQFEQIAYQDTTLPFQKQRAQEAIFTLRISNHDDSPIRITGVQVNYWADDLIFAADAEETKVTLSFGADPSVEAPIYDIASYQNDILQGDIDRLPLGAVVYQQQLKQDEAPRYYTAIFNVVICLVAALLGVLILLKLRQKS